MGAASAHRVVTWPEGARLRQRFSAERIGSVSPGTLRVLALGLVAVGLIVTVISLRLLVGHSSSLGPAAAGSLAFAVVASVAAIATALIARLSAGVVVTDRSVVVLRPLGHAEFPLTKDTRFTLPARRQGAELRLGPRRSEVIPELGGGTLVFHSADCLKRRVAEANSALDFHLYHPAESPGTPSVSNPARAGKVGNHELRRRWSRRVDDVRSRSETTEAR